MIPYSAYFPVMNHSRFIRWILSFFVFLPVLLTAQPWQNICTHGLTLYKDNQNNIEGVYYTTVNPGTNNDTSFITFNHWRIKFNNYGFEGDRSPIFLKNILKEQSGRFTFTEIDYSGDTVERVIINTLASLNDSWIFYQRNMLDGSRVDATVTEITTDTVLGYIDSVKVMTLQRKDNSGNPIEDPINGKQVILGKDLGLVRTFDFYYMLDDRKQYNLAGKSDPYIGIHEMTGKEIFDFQPGDVFQYTGHAWTVYAMPPHEYDYTYQESREILQKDSNNSSYQYRILKSVKATGNPSFQYSGIEDVTFSYNSFTGTPYNLLPFAVLRSEAAIPTYSSFYLFTRSIRSDGRQEKQVVKCGFCCNQYGCFTIPSCGGACFPDDHNLAPGIGVTHILYQHEADHHEQNLTWYKKGSVTYGTPFTLDVPFGYRVLPRTGNAYYSANTGNMKVLKIDSVNVLSGKDSVFYTFPAIRKGTEPDCFDTAGGSILGREIIQRELAIYQMLNQHHDTLTLLTAYKPGTRWTFCSLQGGDRIEATILSKYSDTILGTADTVKIIQFQAKDADGQNIGHPLNGKTMTLTNSYGFSQLYDFTLLPDSLVAYKLVGSDYREAGKRDLSWDRIYQFDTGDQFFYSETEVRDGHSGSDSTETKTLKTVLNKRVSPDNDSITYKFAICRHSVRYLENGDTVVSNVKDTVDHSFSYLSFPLPGWISHAPDEFFPYENSGKSLADSYFMSDSSEYNGRQLRWTEHPGFERLVSGCWVSASDTSSYRISYADGLGEVERISISPIAAHRVREKLIGYVKQNETWGMILPVSCSSFLGTNDQPKLPEIAVKIIPSPVKTMAKVIVEMKGTFHAATFLLYDLSGKEVLHLRLSSPTTSFERNRMAPGLYTWKVIVDDAILTGKVVFE